jgi:hypothetical protein
VRRYIVALVAAVVLGGLTAAAAAVKPVKITDPKDQQILATFLKYAEETPRVISPEFCKKQAASDTDEGEPVFWVITPYLHMPLTAYQLTGDPKYLAAFVQAFENLRSAMTKGPDGYWGWYGKAGEYRDPNDPDRLSDATLTSFGVSEVICDFISLIDKDPKLKQQYAGQRAAYLDLAVNHLVRKHTVRGDYVDLGKTGAIYRSPARGLMPTQARLTAPNNKNAIILHGLLAMYRVTGNDDYMRKAIKLGVRFKHSLTLKNGHYEWNYWNPAGEWDVRPDDPSRWKHWIGTEHRGGYYSLSTSQAVALYEYGLVFDKADMERFLKTQLEECWNGDLEHPVWSHVDGTRPPQYTEYEYIADSLAPFSAKVAAYFSQPSRQDGLIREGKDDWNGGVQAAGYLAGKYLGNPAAQGWRQTELSYGKRFLSKKANRDFVKALEFTVTPPGYTAPMTPQDMQNMPREPERP